MTLATPAKLRNGSWGARVHGAVREGDTIEIRTKAGKSWQARVRRVVWSGQGVSLVSTAREMCAECETHPGTIRCIDSSGISALCCRRCAALPSVERSFA
jgi:hypothetical protein